MRKVPRSWEGSKMIELALVFFVPLLVLRGSPLIGLCVSGGLTLAYAKFILEKPPGYLMHKAYRAGIEFPGFLPRRLRRLIP